MAGQRYRIVLHVEPRYARFVRRRSLAALARRTLAAERVAACELSVAITNDSTLRELNRRYAGRDAPTDVLSFGPADERFVVPAGSRRHLGDIVISYPTASRQGRRAGHGTDDEVAHLIVHGVLHLLGYDHQRPAQERRMRLREELLLGRAVH